MEVPWPPRYLVADQPSSPLHDRTGPPVTRADIVDDERNAERPADGRNLRDREHGKLRIGQRLRYRRARARQWRGGSSRGRTDRRIVPRCPGSFSHLKNNFRCRRKDWWNSRMLSPARPTLNRESRRRLPGGNSKGGNASLDFGNALLQNVVRGVHKAPEIFPSSESANRSARPVSRN